MTFSSLYKAMQAYDEEHRNKTDRSGRQLELYQPDEYLADRGQNTSDRVDGTDLQGRHGDREEVLLEHSIDNDLSEGWGRHDGGRDDSFVGTSQGPEDVPESDGGGWERRSTANDNEKMPVDNHSIGKDESEGWGRHDGGSEDTSVGLNEGSKYFSESDGGGWGRRSTANGNEDSDNHCTEGCDKHGHHKQTSTNQFEGCADDSSEDLFSDEM